MVEKTPDENDNNRSNTASLFLECEDEPLSAAQKDLFKKRQKEFTEQMKKLEKLADKGASITAKDNGSVVFRNVTETTSAPVAAPPMAKPPAANNYRLLMDPRTGRILGKYTCLRVIFIIDLMTDLEIGT